MSAFDLPWLVDRTNDIQKHAGQMVRVTGLKGDLGRYNGMIFDPKVNKGSTTAWIIKPEPGMTMVIGAKNMEWTRCEEVVNVEASYQRSRTTGRNKTSCKTAMQSICAQLRSAIKEKFTEQAKKQNRSAKLDGEEYNEFVRKIFSSFDLDGNGTIDKEELLTGLFSMSVNVAAEETELLLGMFASKEGFTYPQFCKMVVSGDTTRRKRSNILPALQRDETIHKMSKISKQKRRQRIKEKSKRAKSARASEALAAI